MYKEFVREGANPTDVHLWMSKSQIDLSITKNYYYYLPLQKNGKGIKLVYGQDVNLPWYLKQNLNTKPRFLLSSIGFKVEYSVISHRYKFIKSGYLSHY